MKFEIRALRYFIEQISELDKKSKRIVEQKIQLIKQNPYRYKRIHSRKYSRVFRVRLSVDRKELRMVYAIVESTIILICFLNRRKEYKDLEKYLRALRAEAA